MHTSSSEADLNSKSFFKFLNARNKILAKYDLPNRWEPIIQRLMKDYFIGARVKVSNIIEDDSIASPAIIHEQIKMLIKLKLITTYYDDKDARIKYLKPSDNAFELYEILGKELRLSVSW